jgi:hypothetical protein
MMMTNQTPDRHAQALADGYKDETCPKCGTLFEAHIHFVHCTARPCPMISTKDPRSILERLMETDGETGNKNAD